MNKNKLDSIILELFKRSKSVPRRCCFPGCPDIAIDSHLLQKNGILKQLSENTNKLYELKHNPFINEKYYFKPEGINKTFTFPGFCNKHDTQIFKAIEDQFVDYFDYKTQLLFAYRAAVNERRKKEILVTFYDKILNSNILRSNFHPAYFQKITFFKEQEILGIKDMIDSEKLLFGDICGEFSSKKFEFVTCKLSRVDVCSSGVFSYETTLELYELYKQNNVERPPSEIYFNFLPVQNNSYLIIGCACDVKDRCWQYIDLIVQDAIDNKLQHISDLLLSRLENWLCSSTFYSHNIQDRETEIVKCINEAIDNLNERKSLDINLFDRLKHNIDD